MKRRASVIFSIFVILLMNTNANASVAMPQVKTQVQLNAMILAPGPITPTPISARQVCQVAQTVMGLTGFWQSLGNRLSIWITIPVYGSSIICTNYFF
jgi:anthranilate/para-aminobenzoate synthase component II